MTDLSTIDVVARNGVPIVRIRGEIDISNADQVRRAIERAADGNAPGLVVDLQNLEYLDSSGVRLLFQASRTILEMGGNFVTLIPSDSPARRVLELAEATSVFHLEESEEAALRRVRGQD